MCKELENLYKFVDRFFYIEKKAEIYGLDTKVKDLYIRNELIFFLHMLLFSDDIFVGEPNSQLFYTIPVDLNIQKQSKYHANLISVADSFNLDSPNIHSIGFSKDIIHNTWCSAEKQQIYADNYFEKNYIDVRFYAYLKADYIKNINIEDSTFVEDYPGLFSCS